MKGFRLTGAGIASELTEFSRKLIDSYQTLMEIDEIDVGQSATDVIYTEDKLRLVRYRNEAPTRCRTPLLICYALVNRPYIVDLAPDRSLVRHLLRLGIDVYLIDWGYPDAADRCLDLDDYINLYLNNCVDRVLEVTGQSQLNLLGICQGGTFSLCYASLHSDKVRNLVTMVTPVDFHTGDNLLSHLARRVDIDLAVDTYGNIPGQILNDTYSSLMPVRLGLHKHLNLPHQLENRDKALAFLRMEKWLNDSPDQAGEAFRQFVKGFFQENGLVAGTATVGGETVRLCDIHQPILNIYGRHDHLVPPSSSTALDGLTASTDYEALCVPAGHIGVFVSRRSQTQVAPHIAEWLIARDG